MEVKLPVWYEPVKEVEHPEEQQQVDPETAARMVMKAALIETLASRGWVYVERFAETVVRHLEAQAIAEEDDVKSNGLRRDARGARKFKDDLFHRLKLARSIQIEDGFVEVVTD